MTILRDWVPGTNSSDAVNHKYIRPTPTSAARCVSRKLIMFETPLKLTVIVSHLVRDARRAFHPPPLGGEGVAKRRERVMFAFNHRFSGARISPSPALRAPSPSRGGGDQTREFRSNMPRSGNKLHGLTLKRFCHREKRPARDVMQGLQLTRRVGIVRPMSIRKHA
jgi:hypothetical protein